jgi:ATP-dependent RNA helicase RhlE
MAFSSLGLSKILLRAIAEQGYSTPTPIQRQAIPAVLSGRDLMAAAQTGTGKTAAFTLPLLQHLIDDAQPSGRSAPHRLPRALVLVPTRELAAQVGESIRNYGRHTPIKIAVLFGGVGMQPQIEALRRGVDVVIATPGRLLDLLGQRQANLSAIEFLVLDEADRMLDMGFIHDLKRILALLPRKRQNLLFSATYSKEIRTLASGLLNEPESIEVAPRNAPAESVEQRVYHVPKTGKQALLAHLLRSGSWGQTLVFTRTKHGANRLAEQLGRDGFQVAVIHGNKSQSARTQALADFKQDRVQILVATDIAARGLDIQQLPHVVNYELPNVPADYVHRIGRTGRAGAIGEAVSLVSPDEAPQLRDIERLLGRKLPAHAAPGEGRSPAFEDSATHDSRSPRSPAPNRNHESRPPRSSPPNREPRPRVPTAAPRRRSI